MIRPTFAELYKNTADYLDKEASFSGWARTARSSKNFGFIELNDGSCFKCVQVVFDDSLPNFAEAARLGAGSAVSVTGEVVLSPGAKQPFEIKARSVEITGPSPETYPLQKKRHTVEFLRTIAHLRPRSNTFSAVFRVRSRASLAIHRFFGERGFVYVHTPIITGSDAEGAGEMFSVRASSTSKDEFFGKPASLTVSGQLSAEAFAQAFGKVYTFGPTFRAENSNTTRHAAEFWMVEPEIAFADLRDDARLAEDLLKYVISDLLSNCPDEMEFFGRFIDEGLGGRLRNVLDSDFAHISYTEAVEILQKSGETFKYPVSWGAELQTEHERHLTERAFGRPVFVTDYPKEIKAFYMRRNDDGRTVAAMDLLAPGIGEIIGGSQREERLPVLESVMAEARLNPADYWWYLDLRRFGGCPHAGFGLGFERLLMYVTGMKNIRDVIPFPRTAGSLDF
ncbi:MAG: asparagine--tRNA ligase [Clostridiales bacterium]|jgi:asparaginyl-tRNA synthetase|nr:asparagine--tRNA ligase [Clostridiales bacterium]